MRLSPREHFYILLKNLLSISFLPLEPNSSELYQNTEISSGLVHIAQEFENEEVMIKMNRHVTTG